MDSTNPAVDQKPASAWIVQGIDFRNLFWVALLFAAMIWAIHTPQYDWPLRFIRMRVHTCLHLLTTVLPYPVTGGAIGDGDGRLDFDIPDAGLDKDSIEAELARRIDTHADVTEEWITDEELPVVKKFLTQMGDKMDYTVAIDDDGKTSKGYMKAFGIDGIPHAFVVDQKGQIVWQGHPMYYYRA